jgi:starch binding protein with CBM20 domain
MFGLQAIVVATALLATTVSSSSIEGTLTSVGAAPSGTSLSIGKSDGSTQTVIVPPDALVQERAAGKEWRRVSLTALRRQEPLTVLIDAAGRVREVDAEYTLVDTRAVVVQQGYLIGSDGVARKLIAAASNIGAIPLGAYVELQTNPVNGDVFGASVSSHPFAESAAPAVTVTFEVRVPVNTPPSSTIYVATNAQNWTANAIRLSPEPGNRWTATVKLAGGTVLQYKYTRGSWATGERDTAGAEVPNRTLTVRGDAKAQGVNDVVVRWADLPS